MTERSLGDSADDEERAGDSLRMVLLVSLTGFLASLEAVFHSSAPVTLALILLS